MKRGSKRQEENNLRLVKVRHILKLQPKQRHHIQTKCHTGASVEQRRLTTKQLCKQIFPSPNNISFRHKKRHYKGRNITFFWSTETKTANMRTTFTTSSTENEWKSNKAGQTPRSSLLRSVFRVYGYKFLKKGSVFLLGKFPAKRKPLKFSTFSSH